MSYIYEVAVKGEESGDLFPLIAQVSRNGNDELTE